MYLGDGKQCSEFAKQFLEKRSKWRSAQRPQHEADDLCVPAPAVNPNASTEFQEVKVSSALKINLEVAVRITLKINVNNYVCSEQVQETKEGKNVQSRQQDAWF